MRLNFIRVGRSLYFSHHSIEKPHLWYVLTNPQNGTGFFVGVPVFTYKKFKDKTVILDKEDHPFIRHKSVVNYSQALYIPVCKNYKSN